MALIDAFAQLVADFEHRAEDLQQAAALRAAFADGCSIPSATLAALESMEATLDELEAQVASEEQDVADARDMLAAAEQHGARLRHMLAELPADFAPIARRTERQPMAPMPHVIDPVSEAELTGRERKATTAAALNVPQLAPVTQAELDDTPQYVKGRLGLDAVNAALRDVQTLANAKYRLLHSAKTGMSARLRQRYREFRAQETDELRGTFFVLDNDLRGSSIKSDASGKAVLQTLRHLGRLKQCASEGGAHAFVLTSS